jgi:preprotein translocase subunit YajC
MVFWARPAAGGKQSMLDHVLGEWLIVGAAAQGPVPGVEGSSPSAPVQGAPGGTGGPAGGQQPGGNPFSFMWILIAALLFMMLMTTMSGRKQKKQREQMLSGLKRNDKVLTTGGIVGNIAEIHDQEVVVRVDEVSNTRIRFAKAAIQQVLREGKDGQKNDVEVKPAHEKVGAK